nr:hypothetical protein [Microbacterium hydrocarbonoxydans]
MTLTVPGDPVEAPSPLDAEIPATPATPTITVTDLAQYAPPALSVSVDPGNVGIAGLPANFIAASDAHIQAGELFGIPLIVRFSPTTYTYDYGDSSSLTTSATGRTWEELAQAQFTPTPTSHVYRDRGVYITRVDVRYTVEIDLGSGWITVPGELLTTGTPQEIRILEARTALVAHTCTEDPQGTGC